MRSKTDWIFGRKKRIGETGSLRSKSFSLLIMFFLSAFFAQELLSYGRILYKEYQDFKPPKEVIKEVPKEVTKEIVKEIIKEVPEPRMFKIKGYDVPLKEIIICVIGAIFGVLIHIKFN